MIDIQHLTFISSSKDNSMIAGQFIKFHQREQNYEQGQQ
jgi:hypothetical protein